MGFVVVGLTGGIGSGKSTVARFFSDELGVPVVDADRIAREVVAPGTPGLAAVVEAFGEGILGPDGALDRAKLGEVVFADEAARRRLESILHPLIGATSMERLAGYAGEGHPYALYEAALLVETGRHETFAALVVVAVDEATQVARVMARDGLDEAAARARLASQLPLADKAAAADYVIDNGGPLEETFAQAREVHAALLARFAEAT